MPIPENIESLPLFFILGRTRSGTTMLRSMFDAHPDVSIPPEFPVLSVAHFMSGYTWTEQNVVDFSDLVSKSRKFEHLKLSVETIRMTLLEEYHKRGRMDLQLAFRILQAMYVSVFEKGQIKAIGDKNPIYAVHIEQLRSVFPDARFIFIRRHLFSVVKSVYKTNFELHWAAVIGNNWRRAQRQALREFNIRPEKCRMIKYEEIVDNPDYVLQQLCDFIGIDYTIRMLDFNNKEKLGQIYGKDLEVAHASLTKNIRNIKIPDWDSAPGLRYRIAAAWAGNSLTRAGYNPVKIYFRGFYFILGIPSYIAFRSIRFCSFLLRMIRGKRYQVNLQNRLAGKLYGFNSNVSSD